MSTMTPTEEQAMTTTTTPAVQEYRVKLGPGAVVLLDDGTHISGIDALAYEFDLPPAEGQDPDDCTVWAAEDGDARLEWLGRDGDTDLIRVTVNPDNTDQLCDWGPFPRWLTIL